MPKTLQGIYQQQYGSRIDSSLYNLIYLFIEEAANITSIALRLPVTVTAGGGDAYFRVTKNGVEIVEPYAVGVIPVGSDEVIITGLSIPVVAGDIIVVDKLGTGRITSPVSIVLTFDLNEGNVLGAASSTNNNLVAMDGTTGKTIKDSGVAVSTDTALTSNSDSKLPTEKAIKTYVDGLVVGLLDDRGNHDASGNTFPSSGGSGTGGAILKGDIWRISVGGTLGGTAVSAGDWVRALVDTPGTTSSNWSINLSSGGGGGGVSDLDDLSDVDVSSTPPVDGDLLTYDSGSGLWIPQAPVSGSGVILSTTVEDNFNDNSIDGAIWTAGTGVTETGGQIDITHNASTQLVTANFYNLYDKRITAEIVTTPTASASVATQLSVSSDAFGGARYLLFDIYNGNVRCNQGGSGAASGYTFAYNASVHKFFRLTIHAGGISYQTSADGITYTTHRILPIYEGLESQKIYLSQYNTSGSNKTSVFDNFKVEDLSNLY